MAGDGHGWPDLLGWVTIGAVLAVVALKLLGI